MNQVKFKSQLCCLINPHFRCKCGTTICLTCAGKLVNVFGFDHILTDTDPCRGKTDSGNVVIDSRGLHFWEDIR